MKNTLKIPIAIAVAGLIITVSLMLVGRGDTNNLASADSNQVGDFRLVNEEDHIRGNSNASISIVEFSDFECPFCSRLHPTLKRIIEERNDVNWIYRHFPLTSIHSRALTAAVASECVAKLGGNDAFWAFTDTLFNNQRNLGNSLYEESVKNLGLSVQEFNSCLRNKDIAQNVREDLNEVTSFGGRGTPFSVIITADNKLIPFSGALPYESILALIEQ